MVAGNDQKIQFYDAKGTLVAPFEYSHDEKEKEYTCASFSPSGQSVVVGSFNRFGSDKVSRFAKGFVLSASICEESSGKRLR